MNCNVRATGDFVDDGDFEALPIANLRYRNEGLR
jgi:hypothetical protein